MNELTREARFLKGLSDHFQECAEAALDNERPILERTARRYDTAFQAIRGHAGHAAEGIIRGLVDTAQDVEEAFDYFRAAASLRAGMHLLPFACEVPESDAG